MNKKEEKLEDIQEKHERMDMVAPIYE